MTPSTMPRDLIGMMMCEWEGVFSPRVRRRSTHPFAEKRISPLWATMPQRHSPILIVSSCSMNCGGRPLCATRRRVSPLGLAEEHAPPRLQARHAFHDPVKGPRQHVAQIARLAQGQRDGVNRGQFVRPVKQLFLEVGVGCFEFRGHFVEPLRQLGHVARPRQPHLVVEISPADFSGALPQIAQGGGDLPVKIDAEGRGGNRRS